MRMEVMEVMEVIKIMQFIIIIYNPINL